MKRRAAALFAAGALAALASPPDGGPKPVDALVEDLRDEDPEVRLAAREALRDAGQAAKAPLEKLAAGKEAGLAKQAASVLRKIEFDRRAEAAIGKGVSWFKWQSKSGTVWVRLEAKKRDAPGGGWTLTESLRGDGARITQTAETDRDFSPRSIVSTLGDGETKNEVKAEFRDGVCVIVEKGKKDELPGAGTPWTDWSVIRFAAAILADPPLEPEIVVWDTAEQEPATTKLRIGDAEITDGPGGRVKAIPVKIEGLLTAWVTEAGALSHATFGEGNLVTPVEEKDVPEAVRK